MDTTGSEIIHRDFDTEAAQLMQHGQNRLIVLHQCGFSDFKLQAAGCEPGRRQRTNHNRHERAVTELGEATG